MRHHGLCRRLESCHTLPSGTVLKSLWTACGLLSLLLWTANCAKAALPQDNEPGSRSEKLESQRKALENLAEYFREYGISLSDGELEKLRHDVQRRFEEANVGLQENTVLEGLQEVIRNEQIRRERIELRWWDLGPSLRDVVPDTEIKQPPPSDTEFPIGKTTGKRKAIFLDVRNKAGIRVVTTRTEIELLLQKAGFNQRGKGTTRYVSSIDKLDRVVGNAERVIVQGNELPKDLTDHLQKNHEYFRSSSHSPKNTPGEYELSARLLERRAEPGKTRVYNALPQARTKEALEETLDKMELNTGEIDAWWGLQASVDEIQAESKVDIEPATKEAVLHELREGNEDTFMLIGHFADGRIYFPDGETITIDELSEINRLVAPERNLILVMCEAGTVNKSSKSPSEILLSRRTAVTVIAHPERVSGEAVPNILHEFLIDGKSIKEVFILRGYVPITENLGDGLKPEAVRLVGYGFFLDLAEGSALKITSELS